MDKTLVDAFKAIVGSEHILQDDLQSYLEEQRGLYHGRAALVLRPQNTQQVSAIMKLASESKTPIVPQGGNTGLVGAQQPDDSGHAVLVSMSKMNKIRSIDSEGNLALVEAGVILQNLQEAAEQAGRFFPLSLGAEGSCQIGGNLSSNAGGTNVLAYGNTRELCLGLEVVLPDGRILDDLRYVKKDNSGYDLKDMFIGAEGTLGIITAAVMKLFPKPKGKAVAFVGVKSPFHALSLFQHAREQTGGMLTGFELMAQVGMEMTLQYCSDIRDPLTATYPWYVLIELSSHQDEADADEQLQAILEHALNGAIVEDAAIAASIAQQKDFWRLREEMSPAQKQHGGSIKHDISVPVASIPDFIAQAAPVIQSLAPGARIVCFGHMGDGNLHYNVSQPVDMDKQEFLSLWAEMNHRIHTLVMRFHGAFSAEHGIGQLKREELVAFKSPVAVSLMRDIKQLFDPLNIMNPGKVL